MTSDPWLPRLDALVQREGGYSNNPNDRGGETCWGITIAEARRDRYFGPMVDFPRAWALGIYRRRYILEPQLDLLATVDDPIAVRLFDFGVNCGVGTAGKALQVALNVLNEGGVDWPDLREDGAIGPKTRDALRSAIKRRGDAARRIILGMVQAQQCVRYITLAIMEPSQEEFEWGWQFNRAFGDLGELHASA